MTQTDAIRHSDLLCNPPFIKFAATRTGYELMSWRPTPLSGTFYFPEAYRIEFAGDAIKNAPNMYPCKMSILY
jgi:hypothetical protein